MRCSQSGAAVKVVAEEEARALVSLTPGLEALLGSDCQGRLTVAESGQRPQAAKKASPFSPCFAQAITAVVPEHPAEMLLDDSHWANESPLQALTSLVASIEGALFVGARYKSSSMTSGRLLSKATGPLSAEEVTTHHAPLTSLEEGSAQLALVRCSCA